MVTRDFEVISDIADIETIAVGKSIRETVSGLKLMKHQDTHVRFAICIDDGGYVDDLKVRTVYQVLPDESAAKSHYLRIVDETGEDYLYPASYFALIDIPQEVEQIFTLSTPSVELNREKEKVRKKSDSKSKILA